MIRQKQETGVRKWYGDDLLKIQNELFKALEDGILKPTGNVIVAGCEISANGLNFDMAEGIVYIAGKLCVVPQVINTVLPIYLSLKLDVNSKTRQYADGNIKGIEETYTVNINSNPVGGDEIAINAQTIQGHNRLLLPYYNSGSTLSGIPKSNSFNLNSSDILSTSAAVNLLNIALSNLINTNVNNIVQNANNITQNANNIAQNVIDITKNKNKINTIFSQLGVEDFNSL